MDNFETADNVKSIYFMNLGRQVLDLQRAMEINAFDRVLEISKRIRNNAEAFGLKDLSNAFTWMEEVCLEKRLDQLLHSFQVIEVIASRYINMPNLRCSAA